MHVKDTASGGCRVVRREDAVLLAAELAMVVVAMQEASGSMGQ